MRRLALVGLLAMSAGLACKDNGPAAGELTATLTTPNNDDGAIQFTATAGSTATLTSASATCSGCKLFLVKVSGTQYKGIVTGNIGPGEILRLGVSDTKRPTAYTVQVTGVASRTYAVRGTSNYGITLK